MNANILLYIAVLGGFIAAVVLAALGFPQRALATLVVFVGLIATLFARRFATAQHEPRREAVHSRSLEHDTSHYIRPLGRRHCHCRRSAAVV